ncbi:LysR family transcriptional regulator [Acinetobacter nosocomialis]|jgi:DNA-binding transcriptional LysR family regulator|uniref:LysR family transcriptional regulator n=3 Tax=Acinetobacter nosocomialis TaxID=106654 RepID=A0A2T7FS50_ACINO|nr:MULTISPECIES: LysR family transcriptional regulator [Acinetobacter]KCX93359.1 bacterial regulatory helix-turn-helix, lysR family protein [Acinetobacter baumannii 6112]KCY49738.1 bacterial regulatory helix-turn-helix, lysR family protein [Acinetobacter baumannii 1571545]KCZ34194.1 bacterial regulatory helix-turn-helix, lysR family protein [Acinetobacter baumannii 25977_9]MDQ9824490.1 LysR family transcriptional regulator [Acinetobacter sp. 163]AJB47583.1 LysR family transcriptional regulator
MLDQLRAMGVFACVVEKSSFSGAARELGITTSAVSQQIRSLENEMDVILLHRSTRKLSLTEAGQAFFSSCQEMLAAAERGKIRINELRDDLIGDLRIATTPDLAVQHIIPALSHWMSAHRGLSVHFEVGHRYIDLIEERIDIAVRMSSTPVEESSSVVPMAFVDQILVASPSYLNQSSPILHPNDLNNHELLSINAMNESRTFNFQHAKTGEKLNIEMVSRLQSNNLQVAKALCQQGHGIARILYLDAQKELKAGSLIEILPDWKLPAFTLYAEIAKHDQQPMKIQRCVEALKQYFSQLAGGRAMQIVR